MRYIDADALIERILKLKVVTDDMYGMGIARGIERAETAIQMQPTADVVPKSEVEMLQGALKAEERHNELTMEMAQKALKNAKAELAREIFAEIEKSVASKIPMKIRPIFKNDRDFDAGVVDGKRDAFIEVLMLLAEIKKKYTEQKNG